MKKIILIISMIWVNCIFSEWGYVNSQDDFTDEEVKFAYYTDGEHRIQISRENDGSVWLYVTRKKIGTIEPNSILEIRVDKNEAHSYDPKELKIISDLMPGLVMYHWEPKTIGTRIWHGNEEEGCGQISELINGTTLKIRYQTDSLTKDSLKVDLKGSGNAITKGLGLKICGTG